MSSMENFFRWMSNPISKEEVLIWFNIHNLNYEKIELYGDIFKSLNHVIVDTYLGDESAETQISLSFEEKIAHFNWCWNKMVEDFAKEKIRIKKEGEHKNYFESFFMDSFYSPKEKNIKESIPVFLDEIFDFDRPFTKSDLDLLTELYKLMDKNMY